MARVKSTAVRAVAAVATAFALLSSLDSSSAARGSFLASGSTCTGTASVLPSGSKVLEGWSAQVRAACAVGDTMYAFPVAMDWFRLSPDTLVWSWSLNSKESYTPVVSSMTGIDTVANGYVEDCVAGSNGQIYLVFREAHMGNKYHLGVSPTQLVYSLDPATMVATPIAGVSGTSGSSGLNCEAASGTWNSALSDTSFNQMGGIALTPDQDRLIVIGKCAFGLHASIRSIALNASVQPQVVQLAGSLQGNTEMLDGIGSSARILNPRGLAVGSGASKNKYFFVDGKDAQTGSLRVFDLNDNSVTTVSRTGSSPCVTGQSSALSGLCLQGKIHKDLLALDNVPDGNTETVKIVAGGYGRLVLVDRRSVFLVDPDLLEATLVHSISGSYLTTAAHPVTSGVTDERFLYAFRRDSFDFTVEPEDGRCFVDRLSVRLDDDASSARPSCATRYCSPHTSVDSDYSASHNPTTSGSGVSVMINVDGTAYGFLRQTTVTTSFTKFLTWSVDSETGPTMTQRTMNAPQNEIGWDAKLSHVSAVYYAEGMLRMGITEHGTTTVQAAPLLNMRLTDYRVKYFAGAKNVVGGALNCELTSTAGDQTTFMHTTGLTIGQYQGSETMYVVSRCDPTQSASIRGIPITHPDNLDRPADSVTRLAGHHTTPAESAAPVDGVGLAATIANPFGLTMLKPLVYFLDGQVGSSPVLRSFHSLSGLVSTVTSSSATAASLGAVAGVGFGLDQLYLGDSVASAADYLSSSPVWANSNGYPRLSGTAGGELLIVSGASAFVAAPGTGSVYKLDTSGIALGTAGSLGAAMLTHNAGSTTSSAVAGQEAFFTTQDSSTGSTSSADEIHMYRVNIALDKSPAAGVCKADQTEAACKPRRSSIAEHTGSLADGKDVTMRTLCQVGNKGFAFYRSVGQHVDTGSAPSTFYTYDITASSGTVDMQLQTMTGINSAYRGFVSACHVIGSKLYIGMSHYSSHATKIEFGGVAGQIYEVDPVTYVATSIGGDGVSTASSGLNCDLTSWSHSSLTTFAFTAGLSSSTDGKTLYVAGQCKRNSGAVIRAIELSTLATNVVVGGAVASSPSDGTGTNAELVNPTHLARVSNGDVYFLDGDRLGLFYGTWLRRWVPSTGEVTTFDFSPNGVDLGRSSTSYLAGWPQMYSSNCDCRGALLADREVFDDQAEINLAAAPSEAFTLVLTSGKKIIALDVASMVSTTVFSDDSETFTAISMDHLNRVWSATQPGTTEFTIRQHELRLSAGNPLCHGAWAAAATETAASVYAPVEYDGGNRIMKAALGGDGAGGQIYVSFNNLEIATWAVSASTGALATTTPASVPYVASNGAKAKTGLVLATAPIVYASVQESTASIVRIDVSSGASAAANEVVTTQAASNGACSSSTPDTGSGFGLGSTRGTHAMGLSADGSYMMVMSCRKIFRVDVSTTAGHNHASSLGAANAARGVVDGVGTAAAYTAARSMVQAATGVWYFMDASDEVIDSTVSDARVVYIRSYVEASSSSAVDGVVTTIGASSRQSVSTFDRSMHLDELPLFWLSSMYYSIDRVGGSNSNWLAFSDMSSVYLVDVSSSEAHSTRGAARAYSLLELVNPSDNTDEGIVSVDFSSATSLFLTQASTATGSHAKVRHFSLEWNSVGGFAQPTLKRAAVQQRQMEQQQQQRRGLKL